MYIYTVHTYNTYTDLEKDTRQRLEEAIKTVKSYIHTYIHTYADLEKDTRQRLEEAIKTVKSYIHAYIHTYIHTYTHRSRKGHQTEA